MCFIMKINVRPFSQLWIPQRTKNKIKPWSAGRIGNVEFHLWHLEIPTFIGEKKVTRSRLKAVKIRSCIDSSLHFSLWRTTTQNATGSLLLSFVFVSFVSIRFSKTTVLVHIKEKGVRIPAGAGNFFSSPPCPDRLWGQPSLLGALSLEVKRSRREADHSPPSSAEVK
jgi:hypothetical protein